MNKGNPHSSQAASSRASEGGEAHAMPSAPPIYMSEPYSTYEMKRDGSFAHEVPSKPISSTKSHVKFTETRDGTDAFIPGGRGAYDSRRVRPNNFQKWVKKFSGSGDPYDHLASFKQVARAEQVNDLHTKVEGFGLTLEGRALSWFQTLDPSEYLSFEALEKDFIAAFSKTGLNTMCCLKYMDLSKSRASL